MKKFIAIILTVFMLTSVLAVSAEEFNDISGHWAEKEIVSAQENGIINGDGTGNFRPNDTVTRAEYVKMLSAMIAPKFGIEEVPDDYKTDSNWYSKYYNFAIIAFLDQNVEISINGINPGVFSNNATAPVERWEMAYMAGSLIKNLMPVTVSNDLKYADKAEVEALGITDYIKFTAENNIIKGDQNGNFKAYATGSRAEAVVIVSRINDFINSYIEEQTAKQEEEYNKIIAEYDSKLIIYPEEDIPKEEVKVKFTMEGGQSFIVKLYPQYAPQTVANFVKLVNSGFYNGLTFHRIVDDFVAQGGDPNGDGTGMAENYIFGEFSSNGFEGNTLSHEAGVISMARGGYPNSASSQFFICYKDSPFLDGNYAAFGKVISGMNTVKLFLNTEKVENEIGEIAKPVNPIVIKKAVVIK